MKIRYTNLAIADLQRLRAFIAESAPDAAGRFAEDLVQRIERSTAVPLMGRKINHVSADDSSRDLVTDGYIVRYHFLPDPVLVLRIWHQRETRIP